MRLGTGVLCGFVPAKPGVAPICPNAAWMERAINRFVMAGTSIADLAAHRTRASGSDRLTNISRLQHLHIPIQIVRPMTIDVYPSSDMLVRTIIGENMTTEGNIGRTIAARIGRYLEDFEIGDVYEHRPGRTITEADNIQFSLLTMNRHPMHCDAAFAAKSEFSQPLVNSGLTLAIVLGMTVDDVSYHAVANLGWSDVKLVAPVFPGDTIYARSRVMNVRESKSRPTQGIVTTATEGYKADGTVFMSFERMSLVPKRGHGVGE